LGAALCGAVAVFSSTGSTSSGGLGPDPVPRLQQQWNERAAKAEKSLMIDSSALRSQARYHNADEFIAELNASAPGSSSDAARTIDELDRDLTSIASIERERSEKIDRQLLLESGSAEQQSETLLALRAERAAADEAATNLAAMTRTLERLRRAAGSGSKNYDAAAIVEIKALRELEAACKQDRRTELSPEAVDRAAELAESKNADLAWTALTALARSGHKAGSRLAVERLTRESPPRLSELCWSLLVSSESTSIEAATRALEADPRRFDHAKLPALIALVAASPAAYQPIAAFAAAQCRNAEERLALVRAQLPALTSEQARAIERECDAGLLSDHAGDVIAAIVQCRSRAAYPLAKVLLDRHRMVVPPAISEAELQEFFRDEPPLAGRIAQQMLLYGDATLRGVALAIYRDDRSEIDAEAVGKRLRDAPIPDSTALVNDLLPADDSRSVDLAAAVLANANDLNAVTTKYDKASLEMIADERVRLPLMKVALGGDESSRAWAMRQLLRPAFIEQFLAADATRRKQTALLASIVKVLDGNLIALKKDDVSPDSDKGLQVAVRDFSKLPKDVDPGEWSADGAQRKSLAELLGTLRMSASADAAFGPELERITRYVKMLDEYCVLAFDLATVYDVTITKQLNGARRDLLKRGVDSWNFRFMAAALATFRRQRPEWESLTKTLDGEFGTLPRCLRMPAPATATK
jgi:hypothetical protein